MTVNKAIQLAFEHYQQGNLNKAEYIYREILKVQPDNVVAHCNLGIVLREKRQLDEAITCYQKAIKINPNLADVHCNLGRTIQEKGQLDEAIACYQKAFHLNPNYADAHWNMSLTLLLLGNFKQGWKEYECRWKIKDFIPYQRNFSQTIWNGSDIKGLTILLHAEQGLGDAIQFIRYAPLVAQSGAKVIVECPKELTSLIENVEGIHQVVAYGEQLPEFDLHCPLLSLPLIFNTTIESIPAKIPYITLNSLLMQKWRDKVCNDSSKLEIGLVWSGNPKYKKDYHRSLSLETFSPLAEFNKVTFYSLQKGEASKQAKNPPKCMRLIDYTEDIHDFSDTAAFIENLDLVISVDTAVAHLAGAMGKPVWTMIPFAPDWRWMLNREDSPWYPTMRLFRQPSWGDWETVINRMKEELRESFGV